MSGGVDSSVAAALLLEEGYEVIGVSLQLQSCTDPDFGSSCWGVSGLVQARSAAGILGISHYVLDCRQRFDDIVLNYSWMEYSRGRTPNPCIVCNERMKFGILLEEARSHRAAKIATGHYVRLGNAPEGVAFLRRGLDHAKDQSYFLFSLDEDHLAPVVFPVGHLTKKAVREKARSLGLRNADREESQDACFASKGEAYAEALRRHFQVQARPGEIVDTEGRVLGSHQGFHQYTVGQRRGLGIALGQKAWVKSIDPQTARVTLTTDKSDLYSKGLIATGVKWHHPFPRSNPISCSVQVRYRHLAVPAMVEPLAPGIVRVTFNQPVRAVTPGQAVVFYDGDRLLGGGWIERPLNHLA
jgi:tRNA-specific 2-thiouridylase